VRIYLPLTMQGLRGLNQDARLAPAPLIAHAVTDDYRDSTPDIDEEEREYGALIAAAAESVHLIARSGDMARRIVVSADVDSHLVRPRGGRLTSVEISSEVALRQCSSVHVDELGAQAAVSAIVALIKASGSATASVPATDDDSDPLAEFDLLWFATQEIPDVCV